jgi:hypothetical protein
MKCDRPLILGMVLFAVGLGLTLGYCHGNAGLNVAYPFAGSLLKLNLETYGPAAVGGPLVTLLGLIVLAWALFCAVLAQFGLMGGRDEHVGEPTRLLE